MRQGAAWIHNLLAGYSKYAGLASVTSFSDIEKFYDHVSHAVLAVEGKAAGFPEALMRAL